MQLESKFQVLAVAPELLEELIGNIPKDLLKIRRIKGKWSIHEHACHLAEAQHLIINRFKRFQQEKKPVFTPYLPGNTVPDNHLIEMDLQVQLDDFSLNREVLIDLLRSFTHENWHNQGKHPEYKVFNPLIWLRHTLLHDCFHMYRIEELWLTTEAYLRQPNQI